MHEDALVGAFAARLGAGDDLMDFRVELVAAEGPESTISRKNGMR